MRKGRPNKSTQDIKRLLQKRVDFGIVVDKLMELVNGVKTAKTDRSGNETVYSQPPDAFAAKILLEYGFGRPQQDITSDGKAISAVQVLIKEANGSQD